MKRMVIMVAAFGLLPVGIPEASSQSFTKITSGEIVNDGGASRSVNWVDVNNDGFPDLFVSNGLSTGEDNFLYMNNGPDSNFTFRKVLGDPIVSDHAKSDGSSWADIDNDGDLDCFVVNWYGDDNLMYLNNGDGTFVQVFGDVSVTDGGYSETCSWGDYDNDGFVDLYVTNSGYSATGPQRNFLYHNNGDGSFGKISTGVIVTDTFYSRGGTWVDYDDDGDLDMFVANERSQVNNLYKNLLTEDGDTTFSRVAGGSLVTDVASSWSGSWGDYDNDGDEDVFVANHSPGNLSDFLYSNNGDGTFTKITNAPVVSDGIATVCGAWGDYDNDGDLDLFVTTGYSGAPSANLLYRNDLAETGVPTFTRILDGSIVNDPGDSYGCAWGDYDTDGFLDMFVARTQNENQDNVLYRNDASNGNHWVEINCTGTVSNRSAIGAKIRVKSIIAGFPVWQLRVITGQTGYCGQNLLTHVGLGIAQLVDSIVVEWPSGIVDVLTDVDADNIILLTEGSTLSVEGHQPEVPETIHLYQNYPNPFNPSTTIRYEVNSSGAVRMEVFDILGQHVSTLVDEVQQAGLHELRLTSRNIPSSGAYRYVLFAGDRIESKWLLFIK